MSLKTRFPRVIGTKLAKLAVNRVGDCARITSVVVVVVAVGASVRNSIAPTFAKSAPLPVVVTNAEYGT